MTRLIPSFLLVSLVLASSPAQEGAGAPGCYIAHDPARIGGELVVDFGHPSFPSSPCIFSITDGYGPINHPFLGSIWFDTTSPAYFIVLYTTDVAGNVRLQVPVPNNPALYGIGSYYLNAFVANGPGQTTLPAPGWSLSKTVRVDFHTADGFAPVENLMGTGRILHTATSLATSAADDESRVLITGGGGGTIIFPTPSASTEFYNPMKRRFEPGPNMNVPRSGHRAVLLDDGLLLITGGVTTGGLVTSTCELFDPQLGLFLPTGPMASPRTAHAITRLQDGRVLVTGGMSTYVNAGANFVNVLNSSQTTGEVYDPATGTWSTVPTQMSSRRSGHTQTLLPSGDVLVVGGVRGGAFVAGFPGSNTQIPVHTGTAQLYNPLVNTFTSAASLTLARGWHGASLLPNGSVLVTGGTAGTAAYGAAEAQASCELWNGSIWQAAPALPTTAAFHTQVASQWNGDAIIMGGYVGSLTSLTATSSSLRHSGTSVLSTAPIGVHAFEPGSVALPRGFHSLTRLYDGSYLVCGGSHAGTVRADGFTIVEE